jgi:hypothetical protein
MSDQNNKSPKRKETPESVYRRLFPQLAASGWPKDQKTPTREEMREALRQFGDAEDLYSLRLIVLMFRYLCHTA